MVTLTPHIRQSAVLAPGSSTIGADINAQLSALPATGGIVALAAQTATLETQILLSGLTNVTLDLRGAKLTAKNALDVSLIRLLNCTNCTVLLGHLDGNASNQTSSSFGIDLNGGSGNKVIGGRVTNCKTYGVYVIGSNYALIQNVQADANQQAGIAGDVGSSDVIGLTIRDVRVFGNGLAGAGALSGIHLEGNHSVPAYYKELTVDGVVAYDNRGSGITTQNARGYTLRNVHARANYLGGITLAACLYGTGGNWHGDGNDVGNSAGYENFVLVDDTGVTPASQYNSFRDITGQNHDGNTVQEKGTANNNAFLDVRNVSDGATASTVGAATLVTIPGGTDTISERTAAAGVTIDGVLAKDGLLTGVSSRIFPLSPAAAGTPAWVTGLAASTTRTPSATRPTLVTVAVRLGTAVAGAAGSATITHDGQAAPSIYVQNPLAAGTWNEAKTLCFLLPPNAGWSFTTSGTVSGVDALEQVL